MKKIRYSLDPAISPCAPDSDPGVLHGVAGQLPAGARLLPPCCPTKIVGIGRNYASHAQEFGREILKEPIIFLKPPSSLIASGDHIVIPELPERVDYEGELGAVIGKRGRSVAAEQALDYIEGYTVVNDVTARDLQRKDHQWTRAKGYDTFCAVGPWLVTQDEFTLADQRLTTRVNGELKQDARLNEMLFSLPAIIAYVTAFMTLEPGDLIATGTPAGVSPLQPGDCVQVEVEGLGALENSVIKG